MTIKISLRRKMHLLILGGLLALTTPVPVQALGSPAPEQNGSIGMQGTISSPPPTTGATITTPVPGRSYDTNPVTINGTCPRGLLVKVFNNGVFVGSVECTNGSFELQADLFPGDNLLVARVYDALDQAGPDSNSVAVRFHDGKDGAEAHRLNVTSNFAKLGAPAGSEIRWPIIINGGVGPYAIAIDWGDGTATDIKSMANAGTLELKHAYKSAGIYRIVIRASDSTGTTAYLQLVGVGTGAVGQSVSNGSKTSAAAVSTRVMYIWWPVLILVPAILISFWLGSRYELVAIHRRIESQIKPYETNHTRQ